LAEDTSADSSHIENQMVSVIPLVARPSEESATAGDKGELMIKVSNSVHCIPGQDEMIPDAHVYVIGEPGSGDLSLVDAGLMGKGTYKIKALVDGGIVLNDIKRIILTHTHLDHIGCAGELLQQIPGAELWVHEAEAIGLEDGDERTVYGMAAFKQMCQSQYRLRDGSFSFTVNRHLRDGEELNIGGAVWKVIHIPGHSLGGIGLYEETKGTLIPGDVVYADYSIGRFDLHGADGQVLGDSLTKLSKLVVRTLLPGHNRIMTDVPDGYIAQTSAQWAPYLR
jgi:hydroxyacylglutathione hydrolase